MFRRRRDDFDWSGFAGLQTFHLLSPHFCLSAERRKITVNHLKQIADKLPEYGLDAMLITSESGERYALGFHGEGLLLVTRSGAHYTTDGRYIEAAREQITGAQVSLVSAGSGHLAQARAFLEAEGLHNVGFESGAMTVDAHRRYDQELAMILAPMAA